jgi:hypothetical protein
MSRVSGRGIRNVLCPVCQFQYKSNELRRRWDGIFVCPKDWETRHPLEFIRAINDTSPVPFTYPDVVTDISQGGWAINCKDAQNAVVASPAAGNIVTNFPVTYEAMVLLPQTSVTGTRNIIRWAGGGAIFRFETIDRLALWWKNTTSGITYSVITAASFLPAGARGRWARCTMVFTDATHATAYLTYLDSTNTVTTVTATPVITVAGALTFTGTLIIGNTTGISEPAPGPIDDIRLFSTARSAAEILAGWNKLLPTTTTGLVSNWRFDDLYETSGRGFPTTTADSIITQSATVNGATAFPHRMDQ